MIGTNPRGVKRVPTGQVGALGSGAEETRTPDFLLAKEALYQLSYGPGLEPLSRLWAFVDSNHRPLPYQGSALTS